MNPTRVLVIAASAMVRAGLEALVREDSRFQLVPSTYLNGRGITHSREVPSQKTADVILVESDLESAARVITRAAGSPIVLITDDLSRADLRRLLQAGVRAVLSHEAAQHEILAAIQAVAAGLTAFAPEQMELLLPSNADNDESEPWLHEALTVRESEVLAMLAEGASNKEIASRLNISEHTAKFHVSSILAKLGATTRTEAVSRGVRQGLIVI
ncbi:MAG TPA: response regulator transcription factor [Terriglobales bacterium]|nr:response regulator transcription factor [Terriglobales bacterium]